MAVTHYRARLSEEPTQKDGPKDSGLGIRDKGFCDNGNNNSSSSSSKHIIGKVTNPVICNNPVTTHLCLEITVEHVIMTSVIIFVAFCL